MCPWKARLEEPSFSDRSSYIRSYRFTDSNQWYDTVTRVGRGMLGTDQSEGEGLQCAQIWGTPILPTYICTLWRRTIKSRVVTYIGEDFFSTHSRSHPNGGWFPVLSNFGCSLLRLPTPLGVSNAAVYCTNCVARFVSGGWISCYFNDDTSGTTGIWFIVLGWLAYLSLGLCNRIL